VHCGQPAVEEDRGDHRLHRVGHDRRLLPAAGELLAPAEAEKLPQLERPSHGGEPGLVDHRGAELREIPLAGQREVGHEVLGDEQVDDRVPQELEPLVVLRPLAPVLVHPGLVGDGDEGHGAIGQRRPHPLGEPRHPLPILHRELGKHHSLLASSSASS
jgi:hypothetical protein